MPVLIPDFETAARELGDQEITGIYPQTFLSRVEDSIVVLFRGETILRYTPDAVTLYKCNNPGQSYATRIHRYSRFILKNIGRGGYIVNHPNAVPNRLTYSRRRFRGYFLKTEVSYRNGENILHGDGTVQDFKDFFGYAIRFNRYVENLASGIYNGAWVPDQKCTLCSYQVDGVPLSEATHDIEHFKAHLEKDEYPLPLVSRVLMLVTNPAIQRRIGKGIDLRVSGHRYISYTSQKEIDWYGHNTQGYGFLPIKNHSTPYNVMLETFRKYMEERLCKVP